MSQRAEHSSVIPQITDSTVGYRWAKLSHENTQKHCGLDRLFLVFRYAVCTEFQKNVILSSVSPPLPSCPLATGLFPSAVELCP